MIELRMMAAGLAALSAAFNREVTPQVAEVYHGVIGPKLDVAQWQRAVRRALDAETFFPPPAVLLRYGLAEGSPQARAVEAYDRILAEFEAGRPIGPREVLQLLGRAAMEAFTAAGGNRAFAWCEPDDEKWRRKAFVEAWIDTAEQDPNRAIVPGTTTQLLEG